MPRMAPAQDIAFRGSDIVLLSGAIVKHARATNYLPSAYLLPMANGTQAKITAPNAFEVLVRAIIAWKKDGIFPESVSMQILDLNGPTLDPKWEPARDGLEFPVPTADIGNFAEYWLAMAMREGHKLLKGMTFETGYRLNAAQIIVAMATLIDETIQKKAFPSYVVIPMVHSPLNWLDIRNHIVVQSQQEIVVKPPPPIRPDLRVILNAIDLTREAVPTPGKTLLPAFCGTLRIEITGNDPVASIRFVLDGKERQVFKGAGTHRVELNTLTLSDGTHTFAAIAFDQEGNKFPYIFSFPVQNGRISGFTPAEIDRPDDVEVEGMPAET
ncbi:MAG: hypothetical protein ACYC7E_02120 [Armatimonadota bacterium]